MGDARKAGGKAGAFNRKPADRRLVREVTIGQRAPKYWTPMVISVHECKVMEVPRNRLSTMHHQHVILYQTIITTQYKTKLSKPFL